MKLSNRRLWIFGAIAIAAIILLTLVAAPANNQLNSGSTYNRAPDGYGAWYAFMSQRGTPIQRWRKPLEDLADDEKAESPITLLRVNSSLIERSLSREEEDWVKSGNTLVILGVKQPVTEAPFSTRHKIEVGNIKIDTQRREKNVKEGLLGDRFGAIVWEQSIGEGRVVFATTSYLAANAYQDFQGNYEFLAQLVTQNDQPVWVDEYIHGYQDPELLSCQGKDAPAGTSQGKDSPTRTRQGKDAPAGTSQGKDAPAGTSQGKDSPTRTPQGGQQKVKNCQPEEDLFSYLAKTPVFPALVQVGILLLVAIWAGNRRFGKPLTLSAPVVDNSEAYIQALAGVLQKANSSEFILEVVGKEEQLELQKALVLGQVPLEEQALVEAWVQQTGRPAAELEQLLQMQSRKRRISETELLTWLGKWEQIRRHIPS
jgi:hypothetical protein